VIVLGLLFRSAVWAALPLIAVGLGLIYTVGTVAAAGGSFSLVTNILPLLLFILGVTNAAHIVTRYGEECRRTPNDRYAAALSTIQHLGLACLLTALTTACGFLSLLVARASVLQQLAWQAAVGLFLVYFATITVFGITLWRFRPPWMREGGDSKPRLPAIERALIATSNLVLARPWLVLIGSLLLIGLAVTSGLSVRPDGLMTEMYDPDHPQVQTLGYVERNLGGFVTLDIDLRAEPEHELTRADVMQRVLSLERQLAGEPLVISSESFASLLETVREGPLGSAAGDTAPALTDDRVREVLQAVAPVRDVLGLPHFLTSNNERGRVQVRVRDAGTQQTLALIRSIEDRLGALLPASVGVKHRVTGDAAVNAVALDSVIRDLAGSLALASILIFGLMSVLLRSARVGLVASLPNLTPLVLTLGYMGLRGYPLNTSNAIVFTISLGIAVDDSVHFLVRAYEEFSAGRTVDEAIRAAMIGTGRAMVMTTIVLVCGLSALYLSDFVPNRRFAELTSLTMVSALIGDLLLLPACLKLFWQGKGAE
jgi:predicted RND superfamily exporter protein